MRLARNGTSERRGRAEKRREYKCSRIGLTDRAGELRVGKGIREQTKNEGEHSVGNEEVFVEGKYLLTCPLARRDIRPSTFPSWGRGAGKWRLGSKMEEEGCGDG
jgi:hypothetical protein